MEVEAGRMKGNFATGSIEEMTGGVRIKLLSDDPESKPLPVSAGSMKFTWVEGKTTPSTILMEQDVKVDHPQASITAQRAEWNFDTGELVFSGSPVVNSDRLKGVRGDKILLNLKNNTFEALQFRADEVPLKTPEGGSSQTTSNIITIGDIKEWSRLIDSIKTQAQQGTPSPGGQIVKQLNAQNQQLLLNLDTNILLERKEDLLRLINNVVSQSDLYQKDAWSGYTLPDAAQQLLSKSELTAAEQVTLNRLLLETAYPFAFNAQ